MTDAVRVCVCVCVLYITQSNPKNQKKQNFFYEKKMIQKHINTINYNQSNQINGTRNHNRK